MLYGSHRRWRDELGQAVPGRAAGAGDKECVSHEVRIACLKKMSAGLVEVFYRLCKLEIGFFQKKCSEQKIAAALWESMKDEG
jgi:hypothetical protein